MLGPESGVDGIPQVGLEADQVAETTPSGPAMNPYINSKERTSTSPKGNIALIPRQLYQGGIQPASQVRRECSPEVGLRRAASRGQQVAVFRSSATIALTRDCAKRDLGAATGDREGHLPGAASDRDRHPLTSGSLLAEFVAQPRRRTCLSSANNSVRVRMLRGVQSLESFAG